MGMGYAGWSALTLTEAEVCTLAPYEYGCLLGLMSRYDLMDFDTLCLMDRDIESITEAKDYGLTDEQAAELLHAVDEIHNCIEAQYGISVVLGYHNHDDDGDRYDEIHGGFWQVLEPGLYEYADKVKPMIEKGIVPKRLHAVNFG